MMLGVEQGSFDILQRLWLHIKSFNRVEYKNKLSQACTAESLSCVDLRLNMCAKFSLAGVYALIEVPPFHWRIVLATSSLLYHFDLLVIAF